MNRTVEELEPQAKAGFTLVEIMLVLGLTGLLLVGMIAGTFSTIAAQRSNDAVRSFAEYLRTIYSEVAAPETLGLGNSSTEAILGKILVFGYNGYGNSEDNRSVYSATLIGDAGSPSATSSEDFVQELKKAKVRMFCGKLDTALNIEYASTVKRYLPLWGTTLRQINDPSLGYSTSNEFTGSIIIARTPASGSIHTVFLNKTFNLRDNCQPDDSSANTQLQMALGISTGGTLANYRFEDIGFCLRPDHSNLMREVRIAMDGRNTSAITISNTDAVKSSSINPEEINRCL